MLRNGLKPGPIAVRVCCRVQPPSWHVIAWNAGIVPEKRASGTPATDFQRRQADRLAEGKRSPLTGTNLSNELSLVKTTSHRTFNPPS